MTAVSFYKMFDLGVVHVWGMVHWTSESSQFDGLADGRKRSSDALNSDLMFEAVATCLDPSSEGSDDNVVSDERRIGSLE